MLPLLDSSPSGVHTTALVRSLGPNERIKDKGERIKSAKRNGPLRAVYKIDDPMLDDLRLAGNSSCVSRSDNLNVAVGFNPRLHSFDR